ncbi:Uncharacterised protein [Mycobacteroides abscessus subsp. abscessus]|nr:Uncharacterised protein [Mycobacteroides abscessus subsp. abscessus]
MEHLRRAAGGSRRKVTSLYQRDLEATGCRVQRRTGTHDTAADDDHIELLGSQALPIQ